MSQTAPTQLRGVDGASASGEQLIEGIDDARVTGAALEVDSIGDVTTADVQALSDELAGLEADLSDLETRLAGFEDTVAIVTSAEEVVAQQTASAARVCPGFVYRGVCVVDYSNFSPGKTWSEAVNDCAVSSAELCTVSQYVPLRAGGPWGDDHQALFYNDRPVWSADFSDNDAYASGARTKSWILRSADNPANSNQYGYACCHDVTPEPFRRLRAMFEPNGSSTGLGVMVTRVHEIEDTSFPAAAQFCAENGADLCSKSQYVVLNDNSVFGADTRVWTNEQSDNDGGLFSSIIGNTGDNPTWGNLFAYACCASQRPLDNSCPVAETGGVCAVHIHDPTIGDTNFFEAARACAALGADVCSKAQLQKLRDATAIVGPAWSNDGADNDGQIVGGLTSGQPDNPDPESDLLGYACCL